MTKRKAPDHGPGLFLLLLIGDAVPAVLPDAFAL